jgi:site-specific recombinase XerC/ribosomal protein L40E
VKGEKASLKGDLQERKEDIYGYSHRLELVLTGPNGIRKSKNICEANKQILFRYFGFLKARKLSLPRQEKLMKALKRFVELLLEKQFQFVTRDDLEQIVGNLKPKMKGSSKSELADSTLRDFQIIVRQFYAWLFRSPKRQYPEVVAWMEPKEPKPKLQATDLLATEEKDRLKAAALSLRDKALIACFDEAGPRPGELLTAKIKNVRIEEMCAEIDVDGKTGPRAVHIIHAFSDLVNWLDVHPCRDDSDAYLWSDSPDGRPFTYDQARNRLLNIAKKARVNGKRIYLYLLRHGSITENAKTLSDQLLKKRYGWTKGSRSIESYDHLTSSDLKDALLQQAGLVGEKKKEQSSIILCPRCKAPNPVHASLCFRCRSALSFEKAINIEELEKKIGRLEELEKKVDSIEEDLILTRATRGMPSSMTGQEAKEFVAAYRLQQKRLKDSGLVYTGDGKTGQK